MLLAVRFEDDPDRLVAARLPAAGTLANSLG